MKQSLIVKIKTFIQNLKTIDILIFLILILVVFETTTVYVSSENYIFFGDFVKYSDKVERLIHKFQISPLKSIEVFVDSLAEDYTDLPCILILLFRLIFGASRLSFILSLSLAYIVPFCLMTGYLSTQIIPIYPQSVFWISAFLCILTPAIWAPIVKGFPDLAGMTIISWAIFLYWKFGKLKKNLQIMQIAGLCAFSVLFRRYFAYNVRALILTIFIFIFLEYLTKIWSIKNLRRSIKFKIKFLKFTKIFTKKLSRASLVFIYFLVFSPVLIVKAISINYRIRYASYEFPFLAGLEYYVDAYGWLIFGLAVLGYIWGIYAGILNRPRAIFIFLFGFISIVQWCLMAKQIGVQYSTNFSLFVVLGLSSLFWTIWLKAKSFKRFSLIFIFSLILILNAILGLTPFLQFVGGYRKVFAVNTPPMIRRDRSELIRFIHYLDRINLHKKPIYVGASSYSFNYNVPLSWALFLDPPIKLPILRTPDIDSRDLYPLNRVLKSHFIVIANPFQHHVLPEEQMIVKTVVDAFNQQWPFARDYRPLSQKFYLDDQVQVEIYERIRPAHFQTILTTLETMRQEILRSPAEESYWLTLASEQTVEINKNYGGQDTRFESISLSNHQPSSFLYFGTLSDKSSVSGKLMETNCAAYGTLELRLSTLDVQGNPIETRSQELVQTPGKPQRFLFQISSQQARYLRLDVKIPQQGNQQTCQITLDGVTVSQSKRILDVKSE